MGCLALLLTVLLCIACFTNAQNRGPERPLLDHTVELYSEGSQNEGDTAFLTCSIMSSLSLNVASDVSSLQFLFNGEPFIDTDGWSRSPRYVLISPYTPRLSEYSVRVEIAVLTPGDAGIYTCIARGEALEIQSTLRFDVNYLPGSLYPTCSVLGVKRSGEPLQSGEQITLLCSSKTGKPSVELEWQDSDGIEYITVLRTESEHYVQAEVTMNAIYTMNGFMVTCLASSSAFPDYNKSCQAGPFDIAPPRDDGSSTTDLSSTLKVFSVGELTDPIADRNKLQTPSATPSLDVECNPLPSYNVAMVIVIVVLATLLTISITCNAFFIVRSKIQQKPTSSQDGDNNYQGLNSTDPRDPYTSLTTPDISLKTVGKKSAVLRETTSEEDYAQIDNGLSLRTPKDTVQESQPPDSAYVNLGIPSRSRLR